MPPITLETIEAKQTELAELIAKIKAELPTKLVLEQFTIDLAQGEHYAGPVVDATGHITHHLVLMAQRPASKLDWQSAMDWAEEVGGTLPTRQEQALLYANCKPHLKPDWHWSSETHSNDASLAWSCDCTYGSQFNYRKSSDGCAVAVRRV